MSVKVLTYVLEHSAQRGNELLTLIVLADHADENGVCWPSMERIGKLIRADARTARRCVRRLEKSGELKVAKGDGRGNSNRYQIHMQKTLELFEEKGGNLPEGKLPPIETRTNRALNPDTAVSPEPSGTVSKRKSVPGQGKPSPVAALFKVYQAGIERLYAAEYPPSAKANGQLANVVKQLGAEHAAQTLAYFLASTKPYYATRKHALDVFVRDAADLWIACQQAAGGPRATPASSAYVYLEYVDAERSRMAEYPAGEPFEIAKTFAREYASKVHRENVTSVAVRIGSRESRWKPEELR